MNKFKQYVLPALIIPFVLLFLLLNAEQFYLLEKILFMLALLFYLQIPLRWMPQNTWKKVTTGLVYGITILALIGSILLQRFDIFGGGLMDRYFNWEELTLYYVIEQPHFYEETTLELKSFGPNGIKKVNEDFYMDGVGNRKVVIGKKNGVISYTLKSPPTQSMKSAKSQKYNPAEIRKINEEKIFTIELDYRDSLLLGQWHLSYENQLVENYEYAYSRNRVKGLNAQTLDFKADKTYDIFHQYANEGPQNKNQFSTGRWDIDDKNLVQIKSGIRDYLLSKKINMLYADTLILDSRINFNLFIDEILPCQLDFRPKSFTLMASDIKSECPACLEILTSTFERALDQYKQPLDSGSCFFNFMVNCDGGIGQIKKTFRMECNFPDEFINICIEELKKLTWSIKGKDEIVNFNVKYEGGGFEIGDR